MNQVKILLITISFALFIGNTIIPQTYVNIMSVVAALYFIAVLIFTYYETKRGSMSNGVGE